MKPIHRLAAAGLLAVSSLSCLAADPVGSAPSELKLMGAWQAVAVIPKGLGGREAVEPKPNDSILEFQGDHTLRLHAPCGSRRDELQSRGESLFIPGSWSLGKDGRLRLQTTIGNQNFDESIPVRMNGERMQFVNATGKLDEFVRYTAPLPVQCG
ncbi:hypothetical protein [Roseateles sp. NT4]|uniref:hypothetical protein n=1 Tax=Roseateles sp. NT4 TaxID=3453715 RepID=UPI003F703F40